MSETARIDHSKKRPAFTAYCVRDGKEGHKARWSEVGVAWATKDGRGYIVHLNAFPIDGSVALVKPNTDR
jgi:hypothetical protein